MPARRVAVVGGPLDHLGDGAQQVFDVQRRRDAAAARRGAAPTSSGGRRPGRAPADNHLVHHAVPVNPAGRRDSGPDQAADQSVGGGGGQPKQPSRSLADSSFRPWCSGGTTLSWAWIFCWVIEAVLGEVGRGL
jgi:hypothetical protein